MYTWNAVLVLYIMNGQASTMFESVAEPWSMPLADSGHTIMKGQTCKNEGLLFDFRKKRFSEILYL